MYLIITIISNSFVRYHKKICLLDHIIAFYIITYLYVPAYSLILKKNIVQRHVASKSRTAPDPLDSIYRILPLLTKGFNKRV